jgi:hypothetical protein
MGLRTGLFLIALTVLCFMGCELVAQATPQDLSTLSSEDRTSIESACSTAKYVGGPASYHDCLRNQLREMGVGSSVRADQTPTYLIAQAKAVSPQMPRPGPELKRLRYFIGTWSISGEMKSSPFGPAGRFSGTQRNDWGLDGSLTSNWDEQRPGGSNNGQAVYGYDPYGRTYTYHSVDASGEKEDSVGSVDGLTWTWLSSYMFADGSAAKGRFTIKEESAMTYSFKFEMAPANGAWTIVTEGKASKRP